MPEALFALALAPGREDEYRELGDFVRAHRTAYGESRRRFGISRHASWLAFAGGRPWSLVLLTARDFEEVARRSQTSDEPFDVAWRERARSLWRDQAWGGTAVPEVVVDAGTERRDDITQFLAGARVLDGEVAVPHAPLPPCLDRVLVARHQGLLLTYASGDVAEAFDAARGGPWEPLLASLYALPLAEPIIAWSEPSAA